MRDFGTSSGRPSVCAGGEGCETPQPSSGLEGPAAPRAARLWLLARSARRGEGSRERPGRTASPGRLFCLGGADICRVGGQRHCLGLSGGAAVQAILEDSATLHT